MGNESYCGITGHWINDEWQMQSAAFECLQVVERHFAANVGEVYGNFATHWDISSKLMVVVTGNARNMTTAVAKTTFQHIPCLAYTLPLSILCGFKEADTNSLFANGEKLLVISSIAQQIRLNSKTAMTQTKAGCCLHAGTVCA